jgi:hypothetical protein
LGPNPPPPLKSGLAFHTVLTLTYAANSAWQQLVVLTHNLLTNCQIETGAARRTASRKRTVLHMLQTIQSLRFAFFNRAAQLARPEGALRLRLMDILKPGGAMNASLAHWRGRPEFLSHQGSNAAQALW